MFDPTPHVHPRASTAMAAAAEIGVTAEDFAKAVVLATRAGYEAGLEAGVVAWMASANPGFGVYAPGGREAKDPIEAAIFRHCPRRQRDADSRLWCAMRRRGLGPVANDPLDVLLAAEAADSDDGGEGTA